MTAHDHRSYVEGCYRCELGRDEVESMSSDRTPAEALARARWDRELDPDHPWYVAWDDVSPRLRQEQVDFAEADIELLDAAGFRVTPKPDDTTRALAARAQALLDSIHPEAEPTWAVEAKRQALWAAGPRLIADLLAALLDGQPQDPEESDE